MNTELFFAATGDDRVTPDEFFDRYNRIYHFDVDVAANALNTKCPLWFGPGGIESDALEADWGGLVCWMNPPYSVCGAFLTKAREEAAKGATVVALIPARTDTKYWHEHIWDEHTNNWRPGVRGEFIRGRISFELRIDPDYRQLIHDATDSTIEELIGITGLPKTAIKRLQEDVNTPDDELLDSAPFPSVVIVFKQECRQ